MLTIEKKHFYFALRVAVSCVIVMLLQVLFMPYFAYKGVIPNLSLTFILLMALNFGISTATLIAVGLASLMSLFLLHEYFFWSWLLAPLVAVKFYPKLGTNRLTSDIIQIFLCTFYIELINGFLFALLNGFTFAIDNYWVFILSPAFNVVCAYPMQWFISRAFKNFP
jgi:hypothetical protein